ncbi:MAG: hypothetical protein ABUL47_04740, partial [Leifsonia sp.]
MSIKVGLADHFGWAVAVSVWDDDCDNDATDRAARYPVVDRRRIELVGPGVTPAPIHYDGKRLDVDAAAALVAHVRASIADAASAEFERLESDLGEPVASIALRQWPVDFPSDIAIQLRPPYEARADAVMYRQVA